MPTYNPPAMCSVSFVRLILAWLIERVLGSKDGKNVLQKIEIIGHDGDSTRQGSIGIQS